MLTDKTEIINRLRKEMLLLEGFKPALSGKALDVGLGAIEAAFPNAAFPLGAVHEFLCADYKDTAATTGFMSGILGGLLKNGGTGLWISSSTKLFPPALKFFGLEPDRIIFIDPKKETDVLWAIEEALKCEGLAAVVGEIQNISFTASRRLQLAVEQSRATGFLLNRNARKANVTACVSQWKITSIPAEPEDGLPGAGFPRWKVSLLKVRNGHPGSWNITWRGGRFQHDPLKLTALLPELKKKIG